MNDEEKQIEELAEVIERARLKARGVNGSMNQGFGMWYAKALWEMGYRKDESKCPLQCRNCKFSRMATDAERRDIGLELLVCEISRNSDGDVYLVTPDHYCGHAEKEAGYRKLEEREWEEVAIVKRGEIVKRCYECPVCSVLCDTNEPLCPVCGAKMKGGAE